MSRINTQVQAHLPTSEAQVLPQRAARAMQSFSPWTLAGGWDYWVVRAFLVACTGALSYTLRPFELRGLAAAGVGFLISLVNLAIWLGIGMLWWKVVGLW